MYIFGSWLLTTQGHKEITFPLPATQLQNDHCPVNSGLSTVKHTHTHFLAPACLKWIQRPWCEPDICSIKLKPQITHDLTHDSGADFRPKQWCWQWNSRIKMSVSLLFRVPYLKNCWSDFFAVDIHGTIWVNSDDFVDGPLFLKNYYQDKGIILTISDKS